MRNINKKNEVIILFVMGILILWLSSGARAQPLNIKGTSPQNSFSSAFSHRYTPGGGTGLNLIAYAGPTDLYRDPFPSISSRSLSLPAILPPDSSSFLDFSDTYDMGISDGRRYYSSKGPFWGGFTLGLLWPLTYGVSLLGTIPIAASNPKGLYNTSNPNNHLLDDPEYKSGYLVGAKRRKVGKTFTGAGIGVATGAAVILTVIIVIFSGSSLAFG